MDWFGVFAAVPPEPTFKERLKMSNMSYCRFQNTLQDLRDCYESMDDKDLSDEEKRARRSLLKLCAKIADDYVVDGEPTY